MKEEKGEKKRRKERRREREHSGLGVGRKESVRVATRG